MPVNVRPVGTSSAIVNLAGATTVGKGKRCQPPNLGKRVRKRGQQSNPAYGALKTTLKAEINAEAWESLNSDTSRPFPKPKSGRIAVKVINHLGDEVMKVFRV